MAETMGNERDAAGDATGRRLTPKAQATRARLVDLATEVFATEGYATASVRDLARRSGLSSGAIYGTFRGKADLLAAAVERSITVDLQSLPDEVLARPLPEIDTYQFATLDAPARVRLRTLLLEAAVAARADPEVRERVRGTVNDRLRAWTEAHEEWQREQDIDADVDMGALLTMLVSADLGTAVLEALGAELPDPAAWGNVVRALLENLART